MAATPRVRFAPSPTGQLHIGGARTALTNWLFAQNTGGTYVLRIEDTDPERSKREHEDQIVRDLAWLGLSWQEGPGIGGAVGPYRQSERTDLYNAVCDRLLAAGLAYRCNASREDLDALRESQRAAGKDPRYDRRNRDAQLGPDCGPHVVRIKLPVEGATVVHDLIKGDIEISNEKLDDFIIRRTDGTFTYNFVVVVDDVEMGITHVIRGDDHVNNTPKQIHIYLAMGAAVPAFAHLPMILGQDGSRLSKRHGDTALGAYRDMGIPREAMLNYLARLGWSHGDQEIFSQDELVSLFTLEAIGRSGARWDMDKLLSLSGTWLRRLDPADLAARSRPFFDAAGVEVDDSRLAAALDSVQKRARTFVEIVAQSSFYFVEDSALPQDEKARKKWLKAAAGPVLRDLSAALAAVSSWTAEALEAVVVAFAEARELKLGKIAQPVRVALTGTSVGPGLYEMLVAMGQTATVRRLASAADRCPAPTA